MANRLMHFIRLTILRNTIITPVTAKVGDLRIVDIHAFGLNSKGQPIVCITGANDEFLVTGWYPTSRVVLS